MSTQDDAAITFAICNEQRQLRLLELPPSLLDLITSTRTSNLTLKSASPGHPGQPAPTAVLCTDNQTYQVRQVQSSNSVFVLQPSEAKLNDANIPSENLVAIAQCTATLELVPAPPAAVGFLKEHLPTYEGPHNFDEPETRPPSLKKASKAQLLQNAPFSAGEFDDACKELCVFEENNQPWIPTARILANIWKSLILAATVRSIDLGVSFPVAALSGTIEEDGYPITLYEAMVARLSSGDTDLMEGYAALSRQRTVPWLGAILLKSQSPSSEGTPTLEFLREWQDLLLESWRKDATLDALNGQFSEPVKGRILLDENRLNTTASSAPAKVGRQNSRRWHEKFKDARR